MNKKNTLIPVSSKSLSEERRLRQIAKELIVTKTDMTDLDRYLGKFKSVCKVIRELTGDLKFRGTYDEIFEYSIHSSNSDVLKNIEILKLLDTMINSESRKLRLSGTQWLERCWHDEIVASAKRPYSR